MMTSSWSRKTQTPPSWMVTNPVSWSSAGSHVTFPKPCSSAELALRRLLLSLLPCLSWNKNSHHRGLLAKSMTEWQWHTLQRIGAVTSILIFNSHSKTHRLPTRWHQPAHGTRRQRLRESEGLAKNRQLAKSRDTSPGAWHQHQDPCSLWAQAWHSAHPITFHEQQKG